MGFLLSKIPPLPETAVYSNKALIKSKCFIVKYAN